jgi:tripartite-type tricarboxylate transporter receptor subunit TctC
MKAQSIFTAAALMLLAFPIQAQDAANYPNKPVRVVVNVAAGGGVDAASRVIAQKLQEKFGQPFVVENRGGGAGNIAAEQVYHETPDGYTLLSAPGASISINDFLFKKLGYDPSKMEPVVILTSVPLALVVRPNFPAKTFAEFLAYAKANPGTLNFASNGIGTAAHLTAELFMLESGTKMTHVPYKGTGPVLNDLIADHVDLTFIQYSAFLDLYKAGRAKILAVASPQRVAAMPDVPTMSELGFPKIVSNTWNILTAPPGTPQAVLVKLNAAVNEALSDVEAKKRFAAMDTTVEGGSIEAARAYVKNDREHWRKVIEAAHIQPE